MYMRRLEMSFTETYGIGESRYAGLGCWDGYMKCGCGILLMGSRKGRFDHAVRPVFGEGQLGAEKLPYLNDKLTP